MADGERPKTFALSTFYEFIADKLLTKSARILNLECLCLLLSSTPEDCYSQMVDIMEYLVESLFKVMDNLCYLMFNLFLNSFFYVSQIED